MTKEKVKGACSECRRSKLKCDRNFPCQQCIKRGCGGICPFGVLPATKGNRVLKSQAQKLEEQVKALTARNRDLESALSRSQLMSRSSSFSEIDCHSELIADEDGSGSESIAAQDFQTLLQPEEILGEDDLVELPYELLELMRAFPYGLKSNSYPILLFAPFLPSCERANKLLNIYKDNCTRDATQAIIRRRKPLDTSHWQEPPVSLVPIAQEVSVDTVRALILMTNLYLPSHAIERETRWMLIGLGVQIAHRIGLHRDSTDWNMSELEQQRRRKLFWELYGSDLWSSLQMGRPPAMSIQHTDCRFPDEVTDAKTTATGHGWHAWRFRFSANCLSVVSRHCFNVRQAPYNSVLETDKMIRALPSWLLPPVCDNETDLSWSSDPREAMQQALGACLKESSLFHLHKAYFGPAIATENVEPLQHKYAFSVLAFYRSSVRLVSYVRGAYLRYPESSQRSWSLWSNIFRACLAFAVFVIKRPDAKLAPDALYELEKAVALFAQGSKNCRPSHYMSMLEHLLERAKTMFSAHSLSLALKHDIDSASTKTTDPLADVNRTAASDHAFGETSTNQDLLSQICPFRLTSMQIIIFRQS
ncbi:hypothetical protein BT96DRAFT_1002889 [Gymnopus androsaceus JB14]|uniref:Zn(2)-C6 fungal-type domain-containing protein n=1 Tax=Gymnopus androsaceus JB14 TaxID=1447944 RepID=A0A6A4GVA4_9AGAR|nr:hypothetical protein BT96DRAFT_1002889 [Gymnopus androsaceus JB14]